jgi:hypothetical protein
MTVLDRSDAVRKAGSVGAPIGFYEMRILDDEGGRCPRARSARSAVGARS